MGDAVKQFKQFEKLVLRLLQANGFSLVEEHIGAHPNGCDFIMSSAGTIYAIEVKYYRTARAQISLIESAAALLQSRIAHEPNAVALLVVSSILSEEQRAILEQRLGISLVDRNELLAWLTNAPEISDELTSLLEEQQSTAGTGKARNVDQLSRVASRESASRPPDRRGTELCGELKQLGRGQRHWRQYEILCITILNYLFPNDLRGWHAQVTTDDGLNRFDYVCRILPATEFWKFLIEHLNSRYVLFEFKNYSDKIKQGQILTTEKYLIERGLRRVAIVFSRAGANTNALTMAKGAMRDSGKLMLVVDDAIICQMLHMKERGDDPSDLLFEMADEFLLSLSR